MLARCLLQLAVLCLSRCVYAQDYTIPSGWENTVSNASRAERLNAARGAASEIQRRVDPTIGFPDDNIYYETGANMAIIFASQDHYSGNSSWRSQVLGNTLSLYEAEYNQNATRDIAYYGLAEVAAYIAYNDSATRLDTAKQSFDIVYADFINVTDAHRKHYPRPLNTTCHNSSLGGLLFQTHDNATDITVFASAIGTWIALGAHLAELTGNTTYLTAAEQSIQFMQTHMINLSFPSTVVWQQFNVSTCATIAGVEPLAWDIGPYIEGLSIVANITQNSTYTQFLTSLVPSVVIVPEWHDDTQYSLKGTIIRGLLEARLRNPSNTGLVALIDSYITLQYNAVTNNAAIGNNEYKLTWLGNGTAEYTTPGNMAALDVLNAAFVIAPIETSTSDTNPTNSSSKHSSTRIGAIVGGTVGGVAAVVALALVLFACLRRRRRARDADKATSDPQASRADHEPDPFILTAPMRDPVTEKGGIQQRAPLFHEIHNSATTNGSSSPSMAAMSDPSVAQMRPTVGDPDAMHALERSLVLERRLDDLIHTLANHGENESNPPEYDGDVPNHASEHHEGV
ncbi:hypothetical protein PENSPDRAFT_693125 [Peniophora sp. CONT]|nr:hypothetical protein PENSPDRAFT_693125 [Peniophora sp. CONT]